MCERMETTCEQCGQVSMCLLACDPYVDEVHGEEGDKTWWCDNCYDDRHSDV